MFCEGIVVYKLYIDAINEKSYVIDSWHTIRVLKEGKACLAASEDLYV